MKKTAMIVAMSCALACPLFVDAQQCDASEPWYAFGTLKRGSDGSNVWPLYVAGRLPMTLSQLQKDGKMNSMELEIMGYSGGFLRAIPFQVSTAPYGAVCLEFLDLHANQIHYMVDRISGPANGFPTVCISAEGRVTANLQSDGTSRLKYVRLNAGGEVLLDAVQSGCNTICPVGKSTLLIESMTTKPDWSATNGGVALVGQSTMGLKQLQETYDLKHSRLEIGNRITTYTGKVPPSGIHSHHLRERADGALCIVFERYPAGRDAFSDIANFVDAKEAEPTVCIGKGGQVDAKFSIKYKESLPGSKAPEPYVIVRIPHLTKDEEVVLVNTDKDSCRI